MRAIFVLLTIAGLALPANPAISIANQIEGWLVRNKAQATTTPGGATQVSYDATGIDKLVVVFATESGFNNRSTTAMTMSFNGMLQDICYSMLQDTPLVKSRLPLVLVAGQGDAWLDRDGLLRGRIPVRNRRFIT